MPHFARTGATIVYLAVVSEGLLLLLAYIIAWTIGATIEWHASRLSIATGCACAIPLLLGNHLLWRWTKKNPQSVYSRFSQQVVLPLCRSVSIPQAAIIALLSGIGEEALFRGALNLVLIPFAGETTSLIVTSISFAYVHFIGHMRVFGGMLPLYSLVGALLWVIWASTDSLAAVAAAHATYNFLAIVSMKYLDRTTPGRSAATVTIDQISDVPRG
jgi:membrane protease YdiL (CAAX protease family)